MPVPRSCLVIGALLWLAACAPEGPPPTSADDSRESLPIDRRTAPNREIPHATGASGHLRYADGCLFLENGKVLTGLVLPASYRFNGTTLSNGTSAIRLGQRVSVSGSVASDREGPFNCSGKMATILFVDNVPIGDASAASSSSAAYPTD